MPEQPTGTSRRDLIKKGAVAGGVLWVAPAVIGVSSASAISNCLPNYSQTWAAPVTPTQTSLANGYTRYGSNVPPVQIGTTGWYAGNVEVFSASTPYFNNAGDNPVRPSWVPTTNQWMDLVGTSAVQTQNGFTKSGGYTERTFALTCNGRYLLNFTYGLWDKNTPAGSMSVSVWINNVLQTTGGANRVAPTLTGTAWNTIYTLSATNQTIRIRCDYTGTGTEASGAAIGPVTLT